MPACRLTWGRVDGGFRLLGPLQVIAGGARSRQGPRPKCFGRSPAFPANANSHRPSPPSSRAAAASAGFATAREHRARCGNFRAAVGTAEKGGVNWRGCLPKAIGSGLAVGFLTGLFGVGGGFLIIPALVLLLGLPMTVAVGTSLLIVVVNSAAGFAAHAGDTPLDYRLTAVFTLAAVTGSVLASPLATRLPADRLRRWFAYLVLAIAAFVVAQALLNPAAAAGEPSQGSIGAIDAARYQRPPTPRLDEDVIDATADSGNFHTVSI